MRERRHPLRAVRGQQRPLPHRQRPVEDSGGFLCGDVDLQLDKFAARAVETAVVSRQGEPASRRCPGRPRRPDAAPRSSESLAVQHLSRHRVVCDDSLAFRLGVVEDAACRMPQ